MFRPVFVSGPFRSFFRKIFKFFNFLGICDRRVTLPLYTEYIKYENRVPKDETYGLKEP